MSKHSTITRQHVPTTLHWKARFQQWTAPLWRRLAGLESAVLREDIDTTPIRQPIYIAGVPRAGSTLITEILSRHPDVTSHRYSDFPNIHTPYWRNWLAQRARRQAPSASERAHRDRIMVTAESPEAVEEVIWMQFFDHLHDPSRDQRLGKETSNPEFESFYRDHIRKLLLVRARSRYLAKGNYNATRLPYLHKLFPDARFVIPVRNPIDQVASLVKQDNLFEQLNNEDPRVDRQLRMSGHFEFGPARKPICLDRDESACSIRRLWESGKSAEGWALYWHGIYREVLRQLESDPELKSAVLLVKYEDMCREPGKIIGRLLEHTGLDASEAVSIIEEFAGSISKPDYYQTEFPEQTLESLIEITHSTAQLLGYEDLEETGS